MTYVHIPVVWEEPTRSDLDLFFEVLHENQEKRLFIHCAANMRVSAFMALYRILCLGWSREEAFKDVFRIWDPNATWSQFIDDVLKASSS
jgi:protein tyrosine phosphatase (PTP) superfamily phosphohydrolase (DUF442 family)